MPESRVSVGQKIHADSSSNGSSQPAFAQILVLSSEPPQISFGIGGEQREKSGVVVHGDGRAKIYHFIDSRCNSGGSMVDVEYIEGCASQMETVPPSSSRDSTFVRGRGGSLYSRIAGWS